MANEMNSMPRFSILADASVSGEVITLTFALPDRGAGYDTDALRRWFKEDLIEFFQIHDVHGKTVRFSGPNILPGAYIAGAVVGMLGAARVETSTGTGEWLPVAAHDDPEVPIPVTYGLGHIVRAQVFGTEIPGLVVVSVGISGSYQLAGMDNCERVWVGKWDILEFEGVLPQNREYRFADQPRYYRPGRAPAIAQGQTTRFSLFGREVEGRVTSVARASFNARHESAEQSAVLVSMDNLI
jgi:hypothetical protein